MDKDKETSQRELFTSTFKFLLQHSGKSKLSTSRTKLAQTDKLFEEYIKSGRTDKKIANQILDAYMGNIYQVGLRFCVDQPDITEYVSSIMHKVWHLIQTYQPSSKSEFSTRLSGTIEWEATRLKNRYNNSKSVKLAEAYDVSPSGEIDSQYKHKNIDWLVADDFKSAEHACVKREAEHLITKQINSLPEFERNVVKQYFGIKQPSASYTEIAKTQNCSINVVRSALKRALEMLKKLNEAEQTTQA